MSTMINNIRKIKKKDLEFIKNKKLRIQQRELKIKYLESLLKESLNTFYDISKTSVNFHNIFNKKDKNNNLLLNLPRINTTPNKTINSYERMKNYKVCFNKKKIHNSENKIKKFLIQSGFTYNSNNNDKISNKKGKIKIEENTDKDKDDNLEDKKSKENIDIVKNQITSSKKNNRLDELKNDIKQKFIEEKPNTNRSNVETLENNNQKKKKYKKINFDYYLKMQTKAELALKPKLGDDSNDLIEYIKAIKDIRHNIIDDIVEEINKAENRFNSEKPEVDSEFSIRDKSLYHHKWKNLFYIKDYQKFFLKGLKGKISNNNFYQMQKKFLEINNICFADSKGQPIKILERENDI